MKQRHGWDISSLENMIPFERDIYIAMILHKLEEEKVVLEEI
jgi:hypothetical protein